jgi:Na+/proline symporter
LKEEDVLAHGFFEHQDKARKNTKVLVVYFVIAVACIIASVYLASLLIFYGVHAQQQQPGAPPPELVLWDPKLFLYVAAAGTETQ